MILIAGATSVIGKEEKFKALADQSTAGKRADDQGMVQRKWDQAKHVLQPPKKSA